MSQVTAKRHFDRRASLARLLQGPAMQPRHPDDIVNTDTSTTCGRQLRYNDTRWRRKLDRLVVAGGTPFVCFSRRLMVCNSLPGRRRVQLAR